jgi:hypothetical protein
VIVYILSVVFKLLPVRRNRKTLRRTEKRISCKLLNFESRGFWFGIKLGTRSSNRLYEIDFKTKKKFYFCWIPECRHRKPLSRTNQSNGSWKQRLGRRNIGRRRKLWSRTSNRFYNLTLFFSPSSFLTCYLPEYQEFLHDNV